MLFLYFKDKSKGILLLSSFLVFIFFLGLVIYHRILLEKDEKNKLFILINTIGLKRINNEFNKFDDDGHEFLNSNHEFAEDLDIFGSNSLFQYVNVTVTNGGRERLKDILLLKDEISEELIYKRQEAVKELTEKKQFRQNLFIEGNYEKAKNINIDDFLCWLKNNGKYDNIKLVIALLFILITGFSVILCIQGVLPESFILLNLFINFAVMRILNKSMENELKLLSSVKLSMKSFSNILSLINEEEFESDYLKEVTRKINNDNIDASKEMKDLGKILDWIGDSKGNAYYLILNMIFFLDVLLMKKIYKWKNKNKPYVEGWFKCMNEIDALSSICNIPFDNEDFAYPKINENNTVSGKNIGHLLIGRKCVRNDFTLSGNKRVALITGSNMSGKSTFLRTIGINLVLTYIGAPVCADEFSCSIMKIYTCMRTKDNLEESISSFYAEILRIKQLINACKNKEKVFFILDEIFKGTNSEDRYTGAEILIKQLIKYGSSGFVSTHDFELCDMEKTNEEIVNYNFREYYEDNKIKFDYKIRNGRSTTKNAIHLMKLAGIEIE